MSGQVCLQDSAEHTAQYNYGNKGPLILGVESNDQKKGASAPDDYIVPEAISNSANAFQNMQPAAALLTCSSLAYR